MATLGVGSNTEESTTSIIDPVRGEQTAERSDESNTAVVLDSLGKGAQLGGGLDEAQVIDQELDTGAGDGDAALEGVHSLAGAKIESDSGQEAVGGDDGLVANIVKQEASGAVCVLGLAGGEPLLADQSSGLVTQAAGDLDTLQGGAGEGPVGLGVRRSDNLGELDLLPVKAEPVNELVIVVEGLEVHEHRTRGIGGVGDVDLASGSTVQLVGQPGVDRSKGKDTIIVGSLDLGDVLKQPEQLAGRGVRR